jgi:hypothetical protein
MKTTAELRAEVDGIRESILVLRMREHEIDAEIAEREGRPENAAWLRLLAAHAPAEETRRGYLRTQAEGALAASDPEIIVREVAPEDREAVRETIRQMRAERSGS